jgi:hypothetical protein
MQLYGEENNETGKLIQETNDKYITFVSILRRLLPTLSIIKFLKPGITGTTTYKFTTNVKHIIEKNITNYILLLEKIPSILKRKKISYDDVEEISDCIPSTIKYEVRANTIEPISFTKDMNDDYKHTYEILKKYTNIQQSIPDSLNIQVRGGNNKTMKTKSRKKYNTSSKSNSYHKQYYK